MVEGHSAMSTCLHAVDEETVISGSADRHLIVWKVEETVSESVVSSKGKKKGKGNAASSKIIRSTDSAQLNRVYDLRHGRKVNAIAGSSLADGSLHIAVADASAAISLYSITR
jgi:hypothetical protein